MRRFYSYLAKGNLLLQYEQDALPYFLGGLCMEIACRPLRVMTSKMNLITLMGQIEHVAHRAEAHHLLAVKYSISTFISRG